MSTNDNIKLCPFCGSETMFTTGPEHSFIGGTSTTLVLECRNCPAEMHISFGSDGREVKTEEQAREELITLWNQRV